MLWTVLWMACAGETGSTDTGGSADTSATNLDDSAEQIDSGGDTGHTEDTGDTQDTAQDAVDEAAYQAFFDENVLQSITISITGEAMDAMDAEAAAELEAHPDNPVLNYVSISMDIGTTHLDNVGLKLRGGSKTFQDWSGKPSLKLKLDAFDDSLRFAGEKRVVLDNMVDDEAMCREVLGFKLFRDAGLPAPRANFAQVYLVIDGGAPQLYGLYANVEDLDSKWLKHHYEDDGGDLWEGQDSADFSQQGIKHFALAAGDGDRAKLDDARTQVQNHGSDFYADVDDVIDMDNFLELWAISVATGNRAGYPYQYGGFFVYGDPSDDRFDFIPSGADAAFDSATPIYSHYVVGSIAQFCLYYDSTCPARYLAAQADAITFYEGEGVGDSVEALQVLTDSAVVDDVRKNLEGESLTTSNVQQARDTLNYRVEMYPDWLRTHLGL